MSKFEQLNAWKIVYGMIYNDYDFRLLISRCPIYSSM